MEELNKINPLIQKIDKTEVYSVPASYFNNLAADIINKLDLSKEHAYFFGSSVLYSVPENYFTNLPDLILQKVISDQRKPDSVFEEMESLAPLLNTINKKPVYSLPVDFFERVPVSSIVLQKQKTKIISVKNRSKFLRLAAAAVIIPFLAIGVYTLTAKDSLKSNNSKAKNEVKNLSKEEIVNFLKKNSAEDPSSTSQNTSVNDNKLQSSLKQISDKEIQQFLKETGESDEI